MESGAVGTSPQSEWAGCANGGTCSLPAASNSCCRTLRTWCSPEVGGKCSGSMRSFSAASCARIEPGRTSAGSLSRPPVQSWPALGTPRGCEGRPSLFCCPRYWVGGDAHGDGLNCGLAPVHSLNPGGQALLSRSCSSSSLISISCSERRMCRARTWCIRLSSASGTRVPEDAYWSYCDHWLRPWRAVPPRCSLVCCANSATGADSLQRGAGTGSCAGTTAHARVGAATDARISSPASAAGVGAGPHPPRRRMIKCVCVMHGAAGTTALRHGSGIYSATHTASQQTAWPDARLRCARILHAATPV